MGFVDMSDTPRPTIRISKSYTVAYPTPKVIGIKVIWTERDTVVW